MAPTIERVSAITLRASNTQVSVQSYQNALGMELLYGGERSGFSSLRADHSESAILNLEQGDGVSGSGRITFHVTDVDACWLRLRREGLDGNPCA
jgi:catechol 2,3-dioxygenase-like lactoylglutathione lyase family enzyme